MNRKIELVKRKRASQAAQAKLAQEQLDSNLKLKTALDTLTELLESKDDYDFDKLHDQLRQIDKRLDLAPLFSSLEKSLKDTTQLSLLHKTNTKGFSELLRAVKSLKDNPPVVKVTTKADVSQEYKASDADIGSPSFFGFLHPTGKWYIMRQSGTTFTTFRYTSGTKDYRGAWDKRINLSYGLYSEVSL